METIHPGFYALAWAVLMTAINLIFVLGSWRERVATREEVGKVKAALLEEIERVAEEQEKDVARRLYTEKGTTIFLPRDDCKDAQEQYLVAIRKDIGELAKQVATLHTATQADRTEHQKEHQQLSVFIGQVQRFITQHDTESNQARINEVRGHRN